MDVWFYKGPVVQYGRVISERWSGETIAVSAAKAKSNLAYQFRKKYGIPQTVPIVLPNKLERVT